MRTLVVLVALAIARPALADELATARELEAKLEYDQALALVEATLAKGGADPDRYVDLHLLAGRLAAGLDRAQVARDHFARVLALRPKTALPDGTSPKITLPFGAEKARAPAFGVGLALERDMLTLSLIDSLALVSSVRIRTTRAGVESVQTIRPALKLPIAAGTTVVEVAVLDAAGNVLWAGTPPPPIKPIGGPRFKRPPLYKWWPTYATVGAVAFITGTVSALQFSSVQDRFDRANASGTAEFSDLADLERSGKRWGLAANISFGTVIVSAGIAALVGLRYGTVELVVTPTANGAGISGRF